MRISTIGYVGKQGVKSIGRNKMFSLASVATMSACIFVFGLFFSILINFQYIVHKAEEEGVAITVFFNDDATQEQIDNIGAQLKKQDDDVSRSEVCGSEMHGRIPKRVFWRQPGTCRRF